MRPKQFLFLVTIFTISLFAVVPSFGQVVNNFGVRCTGSYSTPIACGYYTEGFQDGAADARNNQDHDYRRYKRKYENQYESFYRQGYESGFSSVRPYSNWTDKQEDAYELGYRYGDNDRDRGISRLPARYEGRYDSAYVAYYRKGYLDGYDQREKQINVPLTIEPQGGIGTFPGRNQPGFGRQTGSLTWSGQVDNRVNIVIQGSTVRVQTVAGRNLGQGTRNLSGTLPRREATVSVSKLDGRGQVRVIQQPNRVNGYTAIVQVFDPQRSSDNYRLQVSWQASNALENYSSGRLRWKGLVDGTVNIRISGEDLDYVNLGGREVTNITHTFDGYLARRRGTVAVRKLEGRGTVTILEQPSRQNNYVAVIRIFDPKSSDDEYEIEVTW